MPFSSSKCNSFLDAYTIFLDCRNVLNQLGWFILLLLKLIVVSVSLQSIRKITCKLGGCMCSYVLYIYVFIFCTLDFSLDGTGFSSCLSSKPDERILKIQIFAHQFEIEILYLDLKVSVAIKIWSYMTI